MTASDGFGTAAYGGDAWSPRTASHAEDVGTLWQGGIDSEWRRLRTVLLRRPGKELSAEDIDAAQYLEPVDLGRAQAEHHAMAEAYRAEGVQVLSVADTPRPTPNRMFCADTFVMTPQGAILARPASTVRAGEEVGVAAALAGAGVPILRTLTGIATFEGADLIWVDERTCLLGLGLRTNAEAARQITATLAEIGIQALPVDMPFGTMHLMGMLRVLDRDLSVAWPRRTPHRAVELLRDHGHHVAFLPDADEVQANRGLNVVALGPRRVLMPAGNDAMRAFYEGIGVDVVQTPCFELRKAAGAVGCLTGVVARDTV